MVKIVEKVLILLIIVLTSFSTMILMNFESMKFNYYGNENLNELSIKLSQDLSGPNITFVKPSENNSIIKKNTYEIVVNITDENPPNPGNVTIQISNITSELFSAPMNYSGDNLWNFIWNNVSDYKSYLICVIRIWANDSSLAENPSWSDPWYVIIDIRENIGPSLIMPIIYIIIVALMFAGIIVFFNKRVLYKTSHKK